MGALADTSYERLGGWSSAFDIKRCLSRSDIVSQGWPSLLSKTERYKLLPQDVLNINVPEFIAVIINTWLVIRILSTMDYPPGRWVLTFMADITSALDWVFYASRFRRTTTQNIARVYAALLTFLDPLIFVAATSHIPGIINTIARRTFPARSVPHVDIDIGHQARASPFDGLSDSYRCAISPTLARLKSIDRGLTRERNRRTALARASYFVW